MAEIQRLAERDKISVGEWVRQALREARANTPVSDAEVKLKTIHRAVEFSFPTGDIDTILAEIDREYQS
jgi:hypothetical protein